MIRRYRPDRILVEECAWRDPAAGEIVRRLEGIPVHTVRDLSAAASGTPAGRDPGPAGKRTLILRRHSGSFMNPCPGDGAELCCNYHVVNLGQNCPMACTYCVPQSFLEGPAVVVFTNVEDMMEEVGRKLRISPDTAFRIGTGDQGDSLALDHITAYTRRLVPFFASLPNAILELKTKSDVIGHLEGLPHAGRTVVSWSVNSERVIRLQERRTASLQQRAAAAARVGEWGYRAGFHFDPLLYYEGWEGDYRGAVAKIFRAVDPSIVAWISLGCLRFTRQQRDSVRERYPRSTLTAGEFVPGHHGKARYFREIREEVYAKMRSWIAAAAGEVFVYLCMENRAAWEGGLGWAPCDTADLSARLDSSVSARGCK